MRTYLAKAGSTLIGAALLTIVATGCQTTPVPVSAPSPTPEQPAEQPVEPSDSTQNPAPQPTPDLPSQPPIAEAPVPGTVSNPPASPINTINTISRGEQEFLLINDRPLILSYFYASPSDLSEWEEDILGDSVLMPGGRGTIGINDGRQNCLYDFMAVFEDGSEGEGYKINICELSSYTFN